MWLNENECSDEELVLFTSNSVVMHVKIAKDETNSDKK